MRPPFLHVIFIGISISITTPLFSQNVAINTSGATAAPSAILDLTNTAHLGFLPPQVALSAVNSISPYGSTPATGLVVYNTASAGSGVNYVCPGYYYWNGADWIGNPYGYNTQYVTGTSDIKTNSSTFAAMSQMSITFTPRHSVVYVSFTASGAAALSANGDDQQYVECEVLNGATVLQGTASIVSQNNYQTGGTIGAWSVAINLPVTATPGSSVTISIDWMTSGNTSYYVQNYVSTYPQYSHRTLFIND